MAAPLTVNANLDERGGCAGRTLSPSAPDWTRQVALRSDLGPAFGRNLTNGTLEAHSPRGVWSGKRDSNPRPSAWKADALAAELFPLWRPGTGDVWWRGKDSNLRRHKPADLQSAPFGRSGTPPHHGRRSRQANGIDPGRSTHGPSWSVRDVTRPAFMTELAKGLEPPTTSLQMRCSTS